MSVQVLRDYKKQYAETLKNNLREKDEAIETLRATEKSLRDNIGGDENKITYLETTLQSLETRLQKQEREQERLEAELKRSKERQRIIQGEYVRSVAGAAQNFDYASTFPSTLELIKKVKAFSIGMFHDWLVIPHETVHEWSRSDDMSYTDYLVRETLVLTVTECHKYAIEVINERMVSWRKFLGYQTAAAPERNDGDVPTYIRSLPGNTFREAHKFIFRDFFPPQNGECAELLVEVRKRVEAVTPRDDVQQLRDLLQAKTASETYRTLVLTLLQTFLECEISRPKPVRFDASFGKLETWNKARHDKETIDPWDDRYKNFSSRDTVRVVLPPVYVAQGANSNSPKEGTEFSTLAAVLFQPNVVEEEQEQSPQGAQG